MVDAPDGTIGTALPKMRQVCNAGTALPNLLQVWLYLPNLQQVWFIYTKLAVSMAVQAILGVFLAALHVSSLSERAFVVVGPVAARPVPARLTQNQAYRLQLRCREAPRLQSRLQPRQPRCLRLHLPRRASEA